MKLTPVRWSVVAALGSIYLIWGSTFLAIRIAIEGIPPLTMAGLRFGAAGVVLIGLCWLLRQRAPFDWPAILIGGLAMVALGNGSVSWAELTIPSGLAALLVAAVPLWVVLLESVVVTRRRPRATVLAGISLGGIGLLVLVGPGLSAAELPAGAASAAGMVLLGTLGWAAGSLYLSQRLRDGALLPLLARQLLAGGAALLLAGYLRGETWGFRFETVGAESWQAVAYLTVVGTLLAYSAYVWLLRVAQPALVGTYAFVNPVVALLLGAWLAGEEITALTGVAAILIVAAVTLVCWPTRSSPLEGEAPANSADGLIARSWEGTVASEEAAEYYQYLLDTGVKDLKKTPGNRGVYVMSREEGPKTHFVLLSLWDSQESIRAFAGSDINKAFYYPDDAKFLCSLEPAVAHYQVRHQPREDD